MGQILAMSFFAGEPLFQVLLMVAMLLTGFYNALWKEPVMVLGGKRLIFLRSVFVLAIVLPYALISGFHSFQIEPSLQSASFRGLLLIFFLSYPGLYFFVKATKSGPTSVVVPVSSSLAIIIPIIFHTLYFKDLDFHHLSLTGFGLLILGFLLLKFRYAAGRFVYMGDGGIRYSVASAILMGTVFFTAESISYSAGPSVTILVQEGSILILSFLHIVVSRYRGRQKEAKGGAVAYRWSMEQIRNHWRQYAWIIGIIGILSGIAVVLRMISNQAPLPMATFILSFSAAISVLVAQIYYGENLKPQQWLAVIFLIVGIFVISWIGDGQLRAAHFFFQD